MSARISPPWRFVLLLALAFGIAGMHTLGHPHQAHDAMSGMRATHLSAPAAHDVADPVAAPRGDVADEMCLAVLTSALLLWGAVLVGRRVGRHTAAGRTRPAPRRDSSRGPPRMTPSCVAITAVSVLRI